MDFCPVPKPEPKIKTRRPLKAKGGSRFPHRRDDAYRKEVTDRYPCVLFGLVTRARVTLNDVEKPDPVNLSVRFEHRCQGPLTPMHVFKTQACGAGDVAEVVSACWATHTHYDQTWTKPEFARATGITEKMLQVRAAKIARELGYKKRGDVWVRSPGGEPT